MRNQETWLSPNLLTITSPFCTYFSTCKKRKVAWNSVCNLGVYELPEIVRKATYTVSLKESVHQLLTRILFQTELCCPKIPGSKP